MAAFPLLLSALLLATLLLAQARKTPGGRTPLGVSRTNSNYQLRKLAGPPVKENPRAEIYELKKQKALRRLDKSIEKAHAAAAALIGDPVPVVATTTVAAAIATGKPRLAASTAPALQERTSTSPAPAASERAEPTPKPSLKELLRLRREKKAGL